MDNQLEWLKNVINMLNNNSDIEHIFVTIHTPAFPNGGHSTDDMWYKGNNNIRPFISGKGVEKGIIERRDEFLDIIVNKSNKVVALLCGDEHNYSRTKISENSERYPKDYPFKKLILSRSIWQITNGTCGAPYYSQEVMPWSPSVEYFTSNYALTLFHINGKKVVIEVINPDTLEKLEELDLN